MKLLMLIYDSGIEEAMLELTQKLELPGYTQVVGAHGEGGTGRKFGDPVWPGMNNVLYVALPDERVADVCRAVEELKGSYRLKPGITTLVVPLEEVARVELLLASGRCNRLVDDRAGGVGGTVFAIGPARKDREAAPVADVR